MRREHHGAALRLLIVLAAPQIFTETSFVPPGLRGQRLPQRCPPCRAALQEVPPLLAAPEAGDTSGLPQALLNSPALKRAAKVLLEMESKGIGGGAAAFLQRVRRQIEAGVEDWDELLGDEAEWASTEVGRPSAEATLRSCQRLLTLGNAQAFESIVTSGSGSRFQASWAGQDNVHFQVSSSSPWQQWGKWSSHFIQQGPDSLVGFRLVASQRKGGDQVLGPTGAIDVKPGDKLYWAPPDRAAILEIATYDQLPEFSAELARILEAPEQDRKNVVAPFEMVEAAKFLIRLRGMSSEEEQLHARVQRLAAAPCVQDFLRGAEEDPVWRELLAVLRPHAKEMYKVTQLMTRKVRPVTPLEPRRVTRVSIGIPPALIVLVLLFVTGFAVSQMAFKSEDQARVGSNIEVRKTVPLVANTPLMPKLF